MDGEEAVVVFVLSVDDDECGVYGRGFGVGEAEEGAEGFTGLLGHVEE